MQKSACVVILGFKRICYLVSENWNFPVHVGSALTLIGCDGFSNFFPTNSLENLKDVKAC